MVIRIVGEAFAKWARGLFGFARNGYLIKFLAVGAASFAIDLGTLTLLHEPGRVDLWIATPIAFLASLVFNFFAQRKFTFQSGTRAHVSFLKYGVLVVVNLLATDFIVNGIAAVGVSYAIGKVIATVATTVWNFLLYKHWIFKTGTVEGYSGPGSAPSDVLVSSEESAND
ncbi:GtrA family protein [Arthrobacter sp. MA-N2]|uniref:GtrA family protein n=1 Tax=Arthrobacter sp. MA-N2 TaxID=1101188 RepID=UPI001E3B0783|nr:GtrA family protein [Arthrobacter sp. MA-N2]